MYATTLFLLDETATVGGMAGGFVDLASLGAHDVQVERRSGAISSTAPQELTRLCGDRHAALVAVGMSDPGAVTAAAAAWLEALDGLPLLCLPVNTSADGSLLPTPGRILEHVLVPGDYSLRSGCVAACLQRIVRYGARVVTLLHVAHADRDRRCPPGGLGEMDEIDTEWVDHLKKTLFRAGVDEVRFIVPEAENSPALDELKPSVSLVVVGAACSGEITRTYCSAAERLFSSGKAVPALMFTAEACSVLGAIRGAA